MKVTVLNTYSWLQKGDAAIVLGTAEVLRRASPNVELTIVSMTPEADRLPFSEEGIHVVSGPFGYIYQPDRSFVWRATAFAINVLLLLAGVLLVRFRGASDISWLPFRTRELVLSIASADLIISVGGGFWTDNSRKAVYVHLLQVVAALISGRPVVSLGVSLGPFRSAWRSRLVGKVLDKTDAIVLREEESLLSAQAMHISSDKVHVYADMAFGLLPTIRMRQSVTQYGPPLRIGVTAKKYLFPQATDPQKAQSHYEYTLAVVIDSLIEHHNAEVVFLPQVIGPGGDDDRIVQHRIMNLSKCSHRVTMLDGNFSPLGLIECIGELDLLIATRFHSAIFSMLANRPVIAIAYEHKTTGIMELMGLGRWVIPIEQIKVKELTKLCTEILEEQDTVKRHLVTATASMCLRAYASAGICLQAASISGGIPLEVYCESFEQ